MSQPNQFNQTSFTLAQKVVADAKRWRQRLDLEEIKLHDADAEFILVREALRSLAKPTRVNYPRLFMGHVDKGFQSGVFVRSEPGFSRTSVDSTESAQKQDD